MSRAIWWLIVIFGLGLTAAILYYALPRHEPVPALAPMPPAATQPSPAAPSAEPQTRFPVPAQAEGKSLPALNESDAAMKAAMATLSNDKALEDLLHLKDFVRRVVATIDNLPRRKLALRLMPVKPAPGKFQTTGEGAQLVLNPDNAGRYITYLRFADAIDTHKLVALYLHYYPLFQQAYQDLGYPQGHFNDRLIEAIDDLLDAPQPTAPLHLVRPKVFYLYADPDLEARSAGQKIMMRIGSEDETRIKAKLREIRAELERASKSK